MHRFQVLAHGVFSFTKKYSELDQRASRGMVSIASSLLRLRGGNQRDSSLGGEQEEGQCLL